ncbi:hypothetical protein ACJJTC_006945 [Scirpophaga incertulas]
MPISTELLRNLLERAEAAIYDNDGAQVLKGNMSGSYMAGYSGSAGFVPTNKTGTLFNTPPGDPVVVVVKCTRIMLEDRILAAAVAVAKDLTEGITPGGFGGTTFEWISGVPGCGKTEWVLARIDPSKDVALTTTTEAAQDMRERLARKKGQNAKNRGFMASKRNAYFKDYIRSKTLNSAHRVRQHGSEESTHGESSKQIGRKRRNTNTDVVTKLRHVNTLDYEGYNDSCAFRICPNLKTCNLDDIRMQLSPVSTVQSALETNLSCDVIAQNISTQFQQHILEIYTPDEPNIDICVPDRLLTQHTSSSVPLEPTVDTSDPDKMTPQYNLAHVLMQPDSHTNTTGELSTQHTSSAPTLLQPMATLSTSTGEISTQHTSASVLLQSDDTRDPDAVSPQRFPSSLSLQPTIETNGLDEMFIQQTQSSELLQPTTVITPDEMHTQPLPTKSLQPTIKNKPNSNTDNPTTTSMQHAPSLVALESVFETATTLNMTNQGKTAPEFHVGNSQIQSMSREEEIEICLQQIKADDERIIDREQVHRIRIDFEEEIVSENNNNLNYKNEVTLIDSIKQTPENCNKAKNNIKNIKEKHFRAKATRNSKQQSTASEEISEN